MIFIQEKIRYIVTKIPGGYFMKKIISILAFGLSLSVAGNAMDRSLIDVCPNETLEKIVCYLDGQGFVAFANACNTSNQVCENVPMHYLVSIVIQAAHHGNVRIVCRVIGLCPDNMMLKPCGEKAFAIWFDNKDRKKLASFFLLDDLLASDCKKVFLLAAESASCNLLAALLKNVSLTALIDNGCADAVINKCIETGRGDIVELLVHNHNIRTNISFSVLMELIEIFNCVLRECQ